MSMTVQDLINALSDLDPDAEVRLAMQPSWPIEYTIGEVVQVDGESRCDVVDEGDHGQIVYIAEGSRWLHLSDSVSRELGWR